MHPALHIQKDYANVSFLSNPVFDSMGDFCKAASVVALQFYLVLGGKSKVSLLGVKMRCISCFLLGDTL